MKLQSKDDDSHPKQQQNFSLSAIENEMPSLAKDIMKKLLSAWAFISAAFNHGQYKLILSSHAAPIWMLGHNKRGEIREREITLSKKRISTFTDEMSHTSGRIRRRKGRHNRSLIVRIWSKHWYTLYVYIHFLYLPHLRPFPCFVVSHPWHFYSHVQLLSICHLRHKVSEFKYSRLHTIFNTIIQYSNYAQNILRFMRRCWNQDCQVWTTHQIAKDSEIWKLWRDSQ